MWRTYVRTYVHAYEVQLVAVYSGGRGASAEGCVTKRGRVDGLREPARAREAPLPARCAAPRPHPRPMRSSASFSFPIRRTVNVRLLRTAASS